jgi:O-Antigen ligase
MSLQYLVKEKNEAIALGIHVLLGVFSMFTPYIFILWFYLVMVSSAIGIMNPVTRSRTMLLLSGYMLGMELFGRMLDATPFVPYQAGNYFMLVVYTLCIFDNYNRAKTHVGFLILLLCIPGFFMISKDAYFTNFLNAFSGIVCLALASIYFSRQEYDREDLFQFMKVAVLPVICILVYLFYKTPSFDDFDFQLKANFQTSGGFGSNQVSTILGAAACLVLLPFLRNEMLFKTGRLFTLALLAAFVFRGLLTFSRGGMLGCLLAVLIAYIFLAFSAPGKLLGSVIKITMFTVIAVFIFQITDQITGGKLSQRYSGETGGTVEGTREKDLRVMTSGRNELAEVEWEVFMDNILLGVGPGNGYEARQAYIGKTVASHTEVTRLVSEQGIPGLLIAIIFLIYPLMRIASSSSNEERYYLIGFFLLAVVTSFHASMRTMLTPLLWGFCCARFRLGTVKEVLPAVSALELPQPKRQKELLFHA